MSSHPARAASVRRREPAGGVEDQRPADETAAQEGQPGRAGAEGLLRQQESFVAGEERHDQPEAEDRHHERRERVERACPDRDVGHPDTGDQGAGEQRDVRTGAERPADVVGGDQRNDVPHHAQQDLAERGPSPSLRGGVRRTVRRCRDRCRCCGGCRWLRSGAVMRGSPSRRCRCREWRCFRQCGRGSSFRGTPPAPAWAGAPSRPAHRPRRRRRAPAGPSRGRPCR